MSRSPFDPEDPFNRVLSQDRVAQPVCHMRELLIFRPIHIVFCSLVVIIVVSGGSVLEGLFEVDFLSL